MIPFLDTSNLSDEQIDQKINDLAKRLQIAMRTNSGAMMQLQQTYHMMIEERNNRQRTKSIENDPNFKPGKVMTTDENEKLDKEEDDGLVNIK